MHTVMVIAGGFLLLGICLIAGRLLVGTTAAIVVAAKIFVPIWFIAALINMWVGVNKAGYSVTEELPIFLVVFAIPATTAILIWWKFSK